MVSLLESGSFGARLSASIRREAAGFLRPPGLRGRESNDFRTVALWAFLGVIVEHRVSARQLEQAIDFY